MTDKEFSVCTMADDLLLLTLDGTLWLCKQGTNFSPAEYARAWEAVNG